MGPHISIKQNILHVRQHPGRTTLPEALSLLNVPSQIAGSITQQAGRSKTLDRFKGLPGFVGLGLGMFLLCLRTPPDNHESNAP